MILPSAFPFLLFFPLPWAVKKVSTLPRRFCGNGLKYNKSLNNQKNKVLQSKFQEEVIKHQCLINLFCTGFQKWAALECWHKSFVGLTLTFSCIVTHQGDKWCKSSCWNRCPVLCAELTFWVTPCDTHNLFQRPVPQTELLSAVPWNGQRCFPAALSSWSPLFPPYLLSW